MLSHYVPIKEGGDFFCIFCEVSGHGEKGLFRCFGASIDDAKVHSQEVGSDLKKDVVGPSLPLHLLLPVVSPRYSWQSLFMVILLRELEISSDVRDFGGVLVVFRKGAGSFHIHRKTMRELCILAVLGIRERPNLAQNLVTHRH